MSTRPNPVPKQKAAPGAVHVPGMRSIEHLHHFQCGACRKWWSIGDAPPRRRWFCPWCGGENQFTSIAPSDT